MAQAKDAPRIDYEPMQLPERRTLSDEAPLRWLRQGLETWKAAPALSLIYGGVFASIGVLVTVLGLNQPQFILTFWSGFLLVGPLFAIGLYRVAQLREKGEHIGIERCLQTLRQRVGQASLFMLMLTLVMLAWIRFSTLAVALYFGQLEPGMAAFTDALGNAEGLSFLMVLFGTGGMFAALMFAIGAWSLPMMMDGKAGLIVSAVSSFRAVLEQPRPMLLWAAIVAGLSLVGMLTFFIGFVFLFPLLGYATWHGYRDLFGD